MSAVGQEQKPESPAAVVCVNESKRGKASPQVILAYSGCCLIWGTTWYLIRVCIQPGAFSPIPAAALRFSISLVVLLAIWLCMWKKSSRPTGVNALWLLLSGVFSALAYWGLYCAETQVTGGLAAVIGATTPLIVAVVAMVSKVEAPSKATILGSLIALAGVALVFHDRLLISQAQGTAIGILMLVAIANALSNVTVKHHSQNASTISTNSIFFIGSVSTLWLIAAVNNQCAIPVPPPLAPSLALLYLSIFGTLIAFASFFYLLKQIRLSTVMTLSFVTPIVALIVDMLFEKQFQLTLESIAGIAVVLIGVAMSVLAKGPAAAKN